MVLDSNGCSTSHYVNALDAVKWMPYTHDVDALDVIKWVLYRQHVDALELTILIQFQSPKGCPTNGPVGTLGLYIQMDSQA